MITTEGPEAQVEMLIRSSAKDVFEAFMKPELITKFWLAKASGPLELGKKVRWDFMVEGASDEVELKALEPNKRILIEWSDGTSTEWSLKVWHDQGTLLKIVHKGLSGAHAMNQALDATQGFTIVICDLKGWLEHKRPMNFVRDKALTLQEQA